MSWIPFHDGLRKGAKRGIPRAVRFIYLELAQESRPYHGRLPLPIGFKNDVDAVHDVLGGSKREIAKALELLTRSDDEGSAMISIEGEPGQRCLVVCAFDRWVRADTSTERTRKWRSNRNKASSDDESSTSVEDRSQNTPKSDPKLERRSQKIQSAFEDRSKMVSASSADSFDGSEQHSADRPVGDASPIVTVTKRDGPIEEKRIGKRGEKRGIRARASRLPEDWSPSPEYVARIIREHGVDPRESLRSFRNYWLSKGGAGATKLDWERTFDNWVLRDFEAGKLSRVPPSRADEVLGQRSLLPGTLPLGNSTPVAPQNQPEKRVLGAVRGVVAPQGPKRVLEPNSEPSTEASETAQPLTDAEREAAMARLNELFPSLDAKIAAHGGGHR